MTNSIPFQLEESELLHPASKEELGSLVDRCIRNSDSFYQISGLALSSGEVDVAFGSGTRTCIAFSCELYLKALLYINGTTPSRKHDLDQLYELLDDITKDKLYRLHPKGNCPEKSLYDYFLLQIKELRKAFEIFRYEHERGSFAYNLQFLMELADALRLIAVSSCKKDASENCCFSLEPPKELPVFMLSRTFAAQGLYHCVVGSRAHRIVYENEQPIMP